MKLIKHKLWLGRSQMILLALIKHHKIVARSPMILLAACLSLLEKELLAPVGNMLRYRFFNRCPQSETNGICL